jgi:hypothetical protein
MGEVGEHTLIIHLHGIGERAADMGMDALDALLQLEDRLREAIEPAGVGIVDGHEIALDDSEGSLWLYGPDARAMLKAALPAVCPSALAPGGRARLLYGTGDDDTATEETFLLADLCARRNS